MTKFKVLTAIACEYAAQGANRKSTLVNVFGGDILVPQFPARFPMAFYFEIVVEIAEPTTLKLSLQVNRKQVGLVESEIDVPDSPNGAAILVLPPLPLSIKEDSVVRMVAHFGDLKPIVLIKKSISQGEIPA